RVAAPVAAAATSRGKIVKSDAPRAAAATTKVSTTKVTTTKTTTVKSEKEKKENKKFPWWLVCLLAFVAVLAVLFFIYKDTVMGWFGNDKPVADTKTEQPANDQTKPGNANDGKTTSLDNPAESERPTIDSDLEILAQAGFSNVSPQNLGSKYKKYYLIGGSYRDPQRANERKRAIGGKEILNVDGSDLFRVVLAGSDSAKEIVDEYNKALKRGVKPADIWLLKNSK
ncbi:MAG: hypothetical protein J6U21_06080, partial [Bacteroidales bacterium]|nr:hypothetical protein [Bacteroidales bacterium]